MCDSQTRIARTQAHHPDPPAGTPVPLTVWGRFVSRDLWMGLGGLMIGVLGFLVGGGWPAKTYRAWSDAQLFQRTDPRYVLQVVYDADKRHDDIERDRSDEVLKTIRDIQSAINALVLSVERHTIALEFWGAEMKEMKERMEDLERRKDA